MRGPPALLHLRIIHDQARTGAFNMAADRYLLGRCAGSTVTLRFYAWEPPCVSLGYMQDPAATVDQGSLKQHRIDWVRRPTGGRAILHWDDLTYCCVFPAECAAMGRSIGESYAVISRCLLAGLRRLQLHGDASDSRLDTEDARRRVKLPCFLAPNRDEIMVNGRKLIGSAQKRTDRGVLQHGSIPISPAFRKLTEFLAVDEDQRRTWRRLLDEKTICLEECGVREAASAVAERLAEGFAEVLGTQPELRPWTREEVGGIAGLAECGG